jgi:hypothetical protein
VEANQEREKDPTSWVSHFELQLNPTATLPPPVHFFLAIAHYLYDAVE